MRRVGWISGSSQRHSEAAVTELTADATASKIPLRPSLQGLW
jgi:hypothetical protein